MPEIIVIIKREYNIRKGSLQKIIGIHNIERELFIIFGWNFKNDVFICLEKGGKMIIFLKNKCKILTIFIKCNIF